MQLSVCNDGDTWRQLSVCNHPTIMGHSVDQGYTAVTAVLLVQSLAISVQSLEQEEELLG